MSHPASPLKRKSLLQHLGLFRFSMPGFLVALVLLMVGSPFIGMMKHGAMIEASLMTLVLILAVQAVGERRRVLVLAIALVLPALVGRWLIHLWPEVPVFKGAFLAGTLVFLLFIILQLLRYILTSPRVNAEVLCAGVSTYLMLGLWWAQAYTLVAWLMPEAFVFSTGADSTHVMKEFTSLYFSFVTLSTVGYGDIVPMANVARMLAVAESVTGSLFLGILIARLVSLYSAAGKNEKG